MLNSQDQENLLEQQPLSISRPPFGLPRQGQAYFAEDVLTAMDSAPH